MLFLLMQDDTRREIPECENVIHRKDLLVLLDALDRPILTLPASEVFGYTVNRRVATALEPEAPLADTARRAVRKPARKRREWLHRFSRAGSSEEAQVKK